MNIRKLSLAALAAFSLAASVDDGHGLDVAGMDKSVRPGDDFDAFANGNWKKTAVIPADRGAWGTFSVLHERAEKRTAALVDELAKTAPAAGSEARKVADFYAGFLDVDGIEKKGLAPIQPELDRIAAIGDKTALARALGRSLRADVDPLNEGNFHTGQLFGLWVAPGFADSHHYMGYLLQGGIGLPDREYYLSTSPHMAELRPKYEAYVARMLAAAGMADAGARAKKVLALETAIATAHVSREASGDVLKANNLWTRAQFSSQAPGLDWAAYFDGAGLTAQASFYVWQPSAFAGESKLVGSESLDARKSWLAFHLLDGYAAVLPRAFDQARFAFFTQTLNGTPQQLERWKRAVGATNDYLGGAVGKIYAQKYFPPSAKATARAMVDEIVRAFGRRIDALDWMTAATKKKAKQKLEALYVGIGYPDQWRDYSTYDVRRGDAFGNAWRGDVWWYRQRVAKLGQPVDRTEWSMDPQTVNAVNLPLQNALNFPAAILEPPFFDAQADAALNFGAIGAVIGHEISHGFDDQGSQFDADGRLFDWWTKEDMAHFKAAAARLVAQYNAYQPFPDLHVNGQLTLGENIADVAGLSASFDGWRASLAGKPAPAGQGFDGVQRFFVAFGQAWRAAVRDAVLRRQVATDEHAPARYRAQTVRNVDGWYDAFGVKAGDKLYLAPKDRVRVW